MSNLIAIWEGGALCKVLLRAEKVSNLCADMTLVTALLSTFCFFGDGTCC